MPLAGPSGSKVVERGLYGADTRVPDGRRGDAGGMKGSAAVDDGPVDAGKGTERGVESKLGVVAHTSVAMSRAHTAIELVHRGFRGSGTHAGVRLASCNVEIGSRVNLAHPRGNYRAVLLGFTDGRAAPRPLPSTLPRVRPIVLATKHHRVLP